MISEQLKEDKNYTRARVYVYVCTKRVGRLICRRYSIRSNERTGSYPERNDNTLNGIDRQTSCSHADPLAVVIC